MPSLTRIMVYKSHLIRATLDTLDFLEIYQEPWLDFLKVMKSHLEIIDGSLEKILQIHYTRNKKLLGIGESGQIVDV